MQLAWGLNVLCRKAGAGRECHHPAKVWEFTHQQQAGRTGLVVAAGMGHACSRLYDLTHPTNPSSHFTSPCRAHLSVGVGCPAAAQTT